MTAYEMGWAAAERGKLLKDCPFEVGGMWISWRAGWKDFIESVGL